LKESYSVLSADMYVTHLGGGGGLSAFLAFRCLPQEICR
jgi:hypothetical protein